MKTKLTIGFILSILIFINCEKSDNPADFPFQAEVIGSNPDCGVFSIKFTSELDKVEMIVGGTTFDGIYIAKNLPVELQQSGIKIKLNIRKIQGSELGACKAMGVSYPWLYVTKAVKE